MSNEVLLYIVIAAVALLAIVVIAFLILNKKMQSSEIKQIKALRQGTEKSSFSTEILFQKLDVYYRRIPILKRYLLKLRRRLEITNIDDEYLTRKQATQILTKALAIIIPTTVLVIVITKSNILLMAMLLIFELFLVDTIIDGMVDKIDNNLLKQHGRGSNISNSTNHGK